MLVLGSISYLIVCIPKERFKEVWEIPEENCRPGFVQHTLVSDGACLRATCMRACVHAESLWLRVLVPGVAASPGCDVYGMVW